MARLVFSGSGIRLGSDPCGPLELQSVSGLQEEYKLRTRSSLASSRSIVERP